MFVILAGKTKKGKERVKQLGSKWRIVPNRGSDNVQLLGNVPGLLLETPDGLYVRWIKAENDQDFDVVETQPGEDD